MELRGDRQRRSVLAGLAGLMSIVSALPASSQQVVPRFEDAGLPAAGQVRLGAAPVFQNWHLEFGPDGSEVPLADDLEGPLLEQVSPGPEAVLEGLNSDADALGFAPISAEEAAVGDLSVRELNAETRTVAFRLEVGVLDRLSADVMVPLVRTEVEPFLSFDPAGATLGDAAAAVSEPSTFFGSISDARSMLEARLEAGQISADREEEARDLLQASGAFASTLQARVDGDALLPLGGTRAGSQLEAFYGQLRSGFQSFDLAIPSLTLPTEGNEEFLDSFFLGTLATSPPGATVRGWLAGESEVGLRFSLIPGFDPDEEGLQLRTAVGGRVRLPFRDANSRAFIDPTSALGLPLGDGQQDVELSLYQDVRLGRLLEVNATLRYGLQLEDELTMTVRSADRPLALPRQRTTVQRDLGDYVKARLTPRVRLNPFFDLGLEYRFWHKGSDSFTAGDGLDASALEIGTEETRHRVGLGASYRPVAPDEGEPDSSVPELGFVYQSAVAGSGGETPVAGLVAVHVRVPVQVF